MLNLLGEIEREEGKPEQAIPYYEEAIAIEKELGRQDELMIDEGNLAFVYCHLGKYEPARSIFIKNLGLALNSDHLEAEITYNLLGLAMVAASEGNASQAAKALGAIDATKDPLLLWTTDRSEYQRTSSAVKALLSDSEFNAFFREGQRVGETQVAQLFLNPPSKEQSHRESSGLTRRELETLRLVAQGLTDAQIAKHLVVSPRTVNAHLTSIYNKLGVNSRAAATRYAVEHGLT
jgi:DNA-binding CsgD family transcriptional regulator